MNSHSTVVLALSLHHVSVGGLTFGLAPHWKASKAGMIDIPLPNPPPPHTAGTVPPLHCGRNSPTRCWRGGRGEGIC